MGLISYSAYLWHQPILSFARYSFLGELTDLITISLCALTIMMAWVSWRYIEKPFRDKTKVSRKVVFYFSSVGIIIFSIVGIQTSIKNGFVERLSPPDQRILAYRKFETKPYYRRGTCFLGSTQQGTSDFSEECYTGETLIWGDSHAAALSFGLRSFEEFAQLTAAGCPPLDSVFLEKRPHCKKNNEQVLKFISKASIQHVFLHSNWIKYTAKDTKHLISTIDKLLNINPRMQITVIGGVPQWYPDLPQLIIRNKLNKSKTGLDPIYLKNDKREEVQLRDALLADLLGKYSTNSEVRFISLIELLCEEECIALINNCNKLEPFAWDYGHLGIGGSVYTASALLSKPIQTARLQCEDFDENQ